MSVETVPWLLDSDPAIAWQAMRDLTDADFPAVAERRAKVPLQGIGAEILAHQQPDGAWRRPGAPTWAVTLFTLLLLRSTGVDCAKPSVEKAVKRLEDSLRWNNSGSWDLRAAELGGNRFFEGEVEPCINGGVLALGAFFGRSPDSLARRLLAEQLPDGGWNCEAPKSKRSSFHTTICVLEGLLEYERACESESAIPSQQIALARRRGETYLLERSLFRRLSTGEVADSAFLELAFPPRYRYDILRALEYFRSAAGAAQPDSRLSEAIHTLESKKTTDGRWLLDRTCDEVLSVPIGEDVGTPSRWNTLRALRVLRWYEGSTPQAENKL